jgi:2-keto-4-pentenoate hydratase
MRTQLEARLAELAAGAKPVGWKVGFNVPAIYRAFGLDGPVTGYITSNTVRADGASIDLTGWQRAALEVEVAVRIGPDGRIGTVAPALELVDLNLPFDALAPILSGNVFHRGVVFGPEFDAADALNDCRGLEIGVHSLVSGTELSTGSLNDDLDVTLGLVRAFLARFGTTLEPGERIITGSIGPAVPIAAGEHVQVDFGPLGSLALAFSGSDG